MVSELITLHFKLTPLRNLTKILLSLMVLLTFCSAIAASDSQLLTLQEAENLALWDKFKLQPTKTSLNSVDAKPRIDEVSSDTHLTFDTVNLSPNTHIPNQDYMSVVKVGLSKSFNNDESSEIQSQQAQATVKQKEIQYQKLVLLRNVRHDWLELYYWDAASKAIESKLADINQLFDKVMAEHLKSRDNLAETLQAKLDLSWVNQQNSDANKKAANARKQLARWIGKANSNRPIAANLPTWPAPPSLPLLQTQLINHPQLLAHAAKIQAIQAENAWTKELNKPSLELGASYGMRQQDAVNIDPKLNMISGELSFNLPSHYGKTQTQDALAGTNRLNAARQQQQTESRKLLKTLIQQFRNWQTLNTKTPNTTTTVNAIPALPAEGLIGHSSANMLALQQQLVNLETELNQLRTKVDLAQARTQLLYFEKS